MPAGVQARSLCFVARKKENRKTYERGTAPEYQTNGKKLGLGFQLCSLGFARDADQADRNKPVVFGS